MFQTLSDYFFMYSKIIAGNPALGFLSIYIAGLGTWLIRNLPKSIYDSVTRACTTTMQLNNAGGWSNEAHYINFMEWFMKSRWSKWSRNIYSAGAMFDSEKYTVGPGAGRHFFFYDGRLYWFRKLLISAPGVDKQKEEIYLHTFGRSHDPLLKLIDAFRWREPENTCGVYTYRNGWTRTTTIRRRSMDTVFIDPVIKAEIIAVMERFINDPDWFRDRGIAYKVSFLLKGISGSGKTSIAKAIASHFGLSLYLFDLASATNSNFQDAVLTIGQKSLLLLEDIDAASPSVGTRGAIPNTSKTPLVETASPDEKGLSLDQMFGLTLSGILNVLDGVVPLDEVVVVTTTNHPEKLDPALIRNSRMDYTYAINEMASEQIHEFFCVMYPGSKLNAGIEFVPKVGCDVQAAFFKYPKQPDLFLKEIEQVSHANLSIVA